MHKGSKRFITLLAAIACSVLTYAQDADEQLLLKHFHSISSEEIAGWMAEICSPEFNGRLAGTPEYLAAAEWVADKMSEWGIKPAGDKRHILPVV